MREYASSLYGSLYFLKRKAGFPFVFLLFFRNFAVIISN